MCTKHPDESPQPTFMADSSYPDEGSEFDMRLTVVISWLFPLPTTMSQELVSSQDFNLYEGYKMGSLRVVVPWRRGSFVMCRVVFPASWTLQIIV